MDYGNAVYVKYHQDQTVVETEVLTEVAKWELMRAGLHFIIMSSK